MRLGLGLDLVTRRKGQTIPAFFALATGWMDAALAISSGDGTETTLIPDRAGASNTIAKGTVGATFRLAWGGQPCIEIGSGKFMRAVGGDVVDMINGKNAATTEFTVITVWQPRHNLGTYPWSFDDVTSSRTLTMRCNSNAYKPQFYGTTDGGSTPTIEIAVPSFYAHMSPKITTVRVGGGLIKTCEDGDLASEDSQAWTWTGTYNCDYWSIGAQQSFTGQTAYIRQQVVFPWVLSDAEKAQAEHFLAKECGLDWKANLGGTGDTLVLIGLGQSNGAGGCTGSPDYSFSVSNSEVLGLDGFRKAMTARAGSGANDANPQIVYPDPVGPTFLASMCEQLEAAGETRKILCVPCFVNSTDAAAWATGATTSPPNIANLLGAAKHRIGDALKAPGASVMVIIDQGEANCDSAAEAADWQTKWNLVRTELETYLSGLFDRTTHYVVVRLALSIAGVGAFTVELRATEDSFEAEHADVILVQAPTGTCEGATGLHRTGPEQDSFGTTIGAAIATAA